jgi:hypothetical protein
LGSGTVELEVGWRWNSVDDQVVMSLVFEWRLQGSLKKMRFNLHLFYTQLVELEEFPFNFLLNNVRKHLSLKHLSRVYLTCLL